MIVYNVTFSVDKEIAEEWLSWMKDKHIPGVLEAGLFDDYRFLKVLSHEDDHTFSYAVQFHSQTFEGAEKYHLNDEIQRRYGDRVLSYSTILKEV
jgi:hypothetical protein